MSESDGGRVGVLSRITGLPDEHDELLGRRSTRAALIRCVRKDTEGSQKRSGGEEVVMISLQSERNRWWDGW